MRVSIKPALAAADLSQSSFDHANLAGADLTEANLSGACLRFATAPVAGLAAADLSRADLQLSRFDQANLAGANLSGAMLDHGDFAGACLAQRQPQQCEPPLRGARRGGCCRSRSVRRRPSLRKAQRGLSCQGEFERRPSRLRRLLRRQSCRGEFARRAFALRKEPHAGPSPASPDRRLHHPAAPLFRAKTAEGQGPGVSLEAAAPCRGSFIAALFGSLGAIELVSPLKSPTGQARLTVSTTPSPALAALTPAVLVPAMLKDAGATAEPPLPIALASTGSYSTLLARNPPALASEILPAAAKPSSPKTLRIGDVAPVLLLSVTDAAKAADVRLERTERDVPIERLALATPGPGDVLADAQLRLVAAVPD